MQAIQMYGPLAARILLSYMMLWTSYLEVTNFQGTIGFMESAGVPAASLMLALALIFKVVGGVSVLIGYKARIGATFLLVFVVLAAFMVHGALLPDQNQMVHLMKNLTIAGGYLMVIAYGAGPLSLDNKKPSAPSAPASSPPPQA